MLVPNLYSCITFIQTAMYNSQHLYLILIFFFFFFFFFIFLCWWWFFLLFLDAHHLPLIIIIDHHWLPLPDDLLRRQDYWGRGWLHYQRFWRWGKWSSGRGWMNAFLLTFSQKAFFIFSKFGQKSSLTFSYTFVFGPYRSHFLSRKSLISS